MYKINRLQMYNTFSQKKKKKKATECATKSKFKK